MAKKRRNRTDSRQFRPDPTGVDLLKVLHMTQEQRRQWLKWGLYILICLVALVLQDVVMCNFHLFGASTDLAAAAIVLIAVMEGPEIGGLFALLASVVYLYSGSAPGAYVVCLMTVTTIAASLFREHYWHRDFGSIMLCAGLALMLYELGLFAVGIVLGRTIVERLGVFLLTGLISWLVMAALYPLITAIGKIGGQTWKE